MGRNYAFLIAAFALISGLRAQTSDIVVFSEEGDKFTLVIDGDVKNEAPAARVVAQGIKNETPLLVVNFEDKQIPMLKQNSWIEHGKEYTLKITTNKKGAKVLRMQGQAPLGTASAEPATKAKPNQFTEDAPASAPATTQEVIATDYPVTKSTTTTTTTEGVPDGNVNMSIGVNGVGLNMAITDGTGGTSTTTTTTTTTHSTTTTSGTTTRVPEPTRGPVDEVPVVVVESGCGQPMSTTNFEDAKKSIESKGFDDTKLTLAKQIANSNCLSTTQVKSIMELFGFEDSKLDFAKFAYDHVTDMNNYYKVNDAFGFSSSVDELNSYIQGR